MRAHELPLLVILLLWGYISLYCYPWLTIGYTLLFIAFLLIGSKHNYRISCGTDENHFYITIRPGRGLTLQEEYFRRNPCRFWE